MYILNSSSVTAQAKTYPIHSSYIYLLTALPFALEYPLPGDFKKRNSNEFNAQGQLFSQTFPLQGPTLEFN